MPWEKDAAPIEKQPEDIAELAEMTNEFTAIAKRCYFKVRDLPDGECILLGAIEYLNLQAIPPLRGNYDWFSNSLFTLLEICAPDYHMGKRGLPFLISLQKGITKSMELTIEEGAS
jgi:hypothetical protein